MNATCKKISIRRPKLKGNVKTYTIMIESSCSDNACQLEDCIEASSLDDAYGKALELAEKLNAKADRQSIFSVTAVAITKA